MVTLDDRLPAVNFKTTWRGAFGAPLVPNSSKICERTGPGELLAWRDVGGQLVPPAQPLFFLLLLFFVFFFSIFPISQFLPLLLLFFPSFFLWCVYTQKKTTDHFLKRGFPHEKTGSKKSHNQIDRPRSCGPRGNHRLLRCCFRRRIIGRQERQHRNSSLASSPSFSLSPPFFVADL